MDPTSTDPAPAGAAEAPAPDLIAAARSAQANSYSPYSGFRVGAALRTDRGTIFAGANVENAAYPQSSCAEASAVAMMASAGERRIVEVAVVTDGENLSTCCGGCRQRLREFAAATTPVHFWSAAGYLTTMTVEQLLPTSFGPENLEGFVG